MTELSGWITTDVGAELTGYSATYIRLLAREGKIGAKRVLRDWLVSREDLLAHKANMDSLGTQKHNPWRDDLGDGGRR
jgi:excisionase family DNA binding protein